MVPFEAAGKDGTAFQVHNVSESKVRFSDVPICKPLIITVQGSNYAGSGEAVMSQTVILPTSYFDENKSPL